MTRRAALIATAAVMFLLLAAALVWILKQPGANPAAQHVSIPASGANPALDVRYTYDSAVLNPAPYNERAEFPLRLDSEGFSFYGKRIRGAGGMLARDPGPMLYDFVGQLQMDALLDYYRLELVEDPVYEDATIGGKLGLHQKLALRKVPSSRDWPLYFPQQIKKGTVAQVEGWVLFTEKDLFFFQAVSAEPLATAERQACIGLLNSLEFEAVLGGGEEMQNGLDEEESDTRGSVIDEGNA
ncbi:hypothetical protein IIA79_07855 [bacterium]|nr:hypothetical protein [bacterium]